MVLKWQHRLSPFPGPAGNYRQRGAIEEATMPLGNFIARLSPPLRRGLQSQGKGRIDQQAQNLRLQESLVIPKNRNLGGEGELSMPSF